MAQQTRASMTAEEFARLPDDGLRYELVNGEVIEMTPASAESGRVSMRVALRIAAYAEEHRLGVTYTAEAGFRLANDPDCVRAPDVAFVTTDRAAALAEEEGFFPGAPDLAVEVVSPTDSASHLQYKITEYLTAGTSLVWVIYPQTKQVVVYRPGADATVLGESGVLTAEALLPGLSIPVAEIFAK